MEKISSENYKKRNDIYPTWPKRNVCRTAGGNYTKPIWTPVLFQSLVDACALKLQDFANHTSFDAIAGCGVSGLPILGALSYRLGIPMIAVRKPGEVSHLPSKAQGLIYSSRYIVIDDLIETGSTIDNIIKSVNAGHEEVINWGATDSKDPIDLRVSPPECVGILLYNYNGDNYDGIPIIHVPGFYD